MIEEFKRCGVCGVESVETDGFTAIPLCKNVVCYHTAVEIIKKALENDAVEKETLCV